MSRDLELERTNGHNGHHPDQPDGEFVLPDDGGSLSALVSAYEKRLIEAALKATRGNRARAAKLLQTTERILGYRVQQYGIDCRLYRD